MQRSAIAYHIIRGKSALGRGSRLDHVTITAVNRSEPFALLNLMAVKRVDTRTERTKYSTRKIAKYLLSLGFLWYILHRWLFPLAHHFDLLPRPSTHTHTCAHDLAWAVDAFAPKKPEVPNSQLAENFFL
jgi:hypothetical protein